MTVMKSPAICREETKFLGLLAKTQEKAAKLGNVSKRTFHNKNKTGTQRRKRIDSTTSPDESSSQINSSSEGINLMSTTSADIEKIEDDFVYDWRLPKFVQTLEKWLKELEKHPQGPKKDTLNEYQLKVEFLGKVVTRLEAERAQHERAAALKAAAAAAAGSSRKSSFSCDVTDGGGGGGGGTSGVTCPPFGSEVLLPHGPASTGQHIAEEIHQKLEGRRNRNVRDQLFDGSDMYGEDLPESDIRRRYRSDDDEADGGVVGGRPGGQTNDLDVLLKAHHKAQEKVAEDMLSLTRSLKEQTIAAGEIVRKDTQVMEQSNELAQKNDDKLKAETERLQERNTSPCRCWIWMLLSVVCFTFIAMVWIMKFFRKRKWHDEL